MQVAKLKYNLIAPMWKIQIYGFKSLREYCIKITKNEIEWPDDSKRKISPKTIMKWYYDYNRGGLEALEPHERSDKGTSRKLDDKTIEKIYEVREEFPKLNATQIYKKLNDEGLALDVNVITVQRFIKNNGLKVKVIDEETGEEEKVRLQFEKEKFGILWQGDTLEVGYLRENGKMRKMYLQQMIDDHTRMIVGGMFTYSDNAENFQIVMKQAVATYGIPVMMYFDNGGPYDNIQLVQICGSLGINLINCKARDPQAKGKIERLNRTVLEEFIYGVNLEKITSLHEMNELYDDFKNQYNNTVHSSLGTTPYLRYKNGESAVKVVDDKEWLTIAFLNRQTRKVRKDNTIQIFKQYFDVPSGYVGQTIEVRYIPHDINSVFMYVREGANSAHVESGEEKDTNTSQTGTRKKKRSKDYPKDGKGNLVHLELTDRVANGNRHRKKHTTDEEKTQPDEVTSQDDHDTPDPKAETPDLPTIDYSKLGQT